MDLKLLKAFVGVAEHGTVSKTAEILHITQPALSRQLHSLEQQVGFKLFDRVGRRLQLTPRGEQFLGDCRMLLSHAAGFTKRAQELRQGDLQVLRLAVSALTVEALFPKFLQYFSERVPGMRIALIDTEMADHIAMLERGEADLSINVINMLPVDERHFASHALPPFQMLAVHAPSFPMASGESIEISALDDKPLLLLNRSYATRNVFDAACHLADFKPNIFLESRSVNTLLALAEAGHGVAIIPSALRIDPARGLTKFVTHRGQPLQLTVATIWDKRRMPARHAEQFSTVLESYVRKTYSPLHATSTPRTRVRLVRGR